VPFLSWLAVTALCVAMVLLYFLPLRYLLLAWGMYVTQTSSPPPRSNGTLLRGIEEVFPGRFTPGSVTVVYLGAQGPTWETGNADDKNGFTKKK